jgi:hypothetical protein
LILAAQPAAQVFRISSYFILAVAVRAGKILLSVDMLLLSVVFIYTGGSLPVVVIT